MPVKKYKKAKENITGRKKEKKGRPWFVRDSVTGELVKTEPYTKPKGKKDSRFFTNKEIEKLEHSNRKNHNQYFTPEFAVEKIISIIPEIKIKNVIDPAVGNGVFLRAACKRWKNINLFGIDIDKKVISDLKRTKLRNLFLYNSDSLYEDTWKRPEIQNIIKNGGFDLTLGNPPFSSRFNRIRSKDILLNYKVARNNSNLKTSQSIEILFLEIFINITKEDGFIVIVLPDGILSNPQHKHIREFIFKKTKILRIISFPREIFQDTSVKTSILILQKKNIDNYKYLVQINDLDKNGKINSDIQIEGKKLLNRMDYSFYRDFMKYSLDILNSNGIIFRPLSDFVIYCKTGKTLYGKERRFSKKGLKFIHTTNIAEVGLNFKKDKKFVQPNSKMDFKDAHTKLGDILISRVGDGCVGKSCVIASKNDFGVVSDCIFIVRINNISPYFIDLFLKTKFMKEWFNTFKHGSAATCITKSEILSIPIPKFHINTQKAIEKQYKEIILNICKNSINQNNKSYQNFLKLIQKIEEKITNGKRI